MGKIYTRAGDRGTTGTFYGRMSKGDILAEAIGTIDELNSAIGLSRFRTSVDADLQRIQKNLLTIGSSLSGSGLKLGIQETKNLEKTIDKLTKELPKLSNFIYPTGSLQLARAICRRAERQTVGYMNQDTRYMNKDILKYLNRLSDTLFTLARFVNCKSGTVEEIWKI